MEPNKITALYRWLLQMMGFKECWHISWIVKLNKGFDIRGDGTYTMRPYMAASYLTSLRKILAKKIAEDTGYEVTADQINIVGMAKFKS